MMIITFFLLFIVFANISIAQELDLDALFDTSKKTDITFKLNDSGFKELEEKVSNKADEAIYKQRKLISKLFSSEGCHSISCAQSYCASIKDEDGRFGCLAGIELAKERIDYAQSYCASIKDEGGRFGCLAGIELAKERIDYAQSYCASIKDEDGRFGCLAGIELAKERVGYAQSYCANIKDEDGRFGCLAGIELAKERVGYAQSYCANIKDEDGRFGCLADVTIVTYFIQEDSQYSKNSMLESENAQAEINKTSSLLTKDIREAKELISLIEESPELLNDPETKELYFQLKGEVDE